MDGLVELKKRFQFPAKRPDVPRSNHGWFGDANRDVLRAVIKPKFKVVVELGSWLGLSTRFLAKTAPYAAIIAIDHWLGSAACHEDKEWRKFIPTLYETFLASSWEYRHQIIPLRMRTIPGLQLVHDLGIRPDLVYIDADHEYTAVRADLETTLSFFPKARIVGDDLWAAGVQQALDDVARKRKIKIGNYECCWWVK